MKYFIYLLSIGLFFSSCSSSDDEDQEDQVRPTTPIVNLKLKVEQSSGNIFDLFVFNLYPEEAVTLLDITNTYDSLVWTIPDLGKFHLLTKNTFTYQWSQVFFLPGRYSTILLGYKENKIITSDTISISITQKNADFLHFNWEDVRNSWGSTGYADVLTKDYSFATYQSVKDSILSITLLLRNKGKEDEKTFAQRSKKVLLEYITTLYSEPRYTEKDTTILTEEYNKLFNDKVKDAKPVSIWITPQSKIVLYSIYEEYAGYEEYRVHAEPNRN